MNRLAIGLSALAILVGAIGGAAAQEESRDFTSDRWSGFTAAFDTLAGVRGQSHADDMLLLVCRQSDRSFDLSFHPAEREGLTEDAEAKLVFDGGAPLAAGTPAVTLLNNILFLLPDRDPSFRSVIDKLMSAKTVEIVIKQPGIAQRRHKFTLNGATEAIAPALKRCGR